MLNQNWRTCKKYGFGRTQTEARLSYAMEQYIRHVTSHLDTKESLISTLALFRNDLSLTLHNWHVIELVVPILKIFYDVTTEVCGEQCVTLSKVAL